MCRSYTHTCNIKVEHIYRNYYIQGVRYSSQNILVNTAVKRGEWENIIEDNTYQWRAGVGIYAVSSSTCAPYASIAVNMIIWALNISTHDCHLNSSSSSTGHAPRIQWLEQGNCWILWLSRVTRVSPETPSNNYLAEKLSFFLPFQFLWISSLLLIDIISLDLFLIGIISVITSKWSSISKVFHRHLFSTKIVSLSEGDARW